MAGSVALPFIADRIPSALPTNTEIQASKEILSQYGSRTVARVGRDFVVKYGRGVDIIEGENMLYVQRMTKIAIPKVYAIYTEPVTRMNYIVMEHIDGDTLAARWPCLSDEQKELVMVKLRRYFDELRRLPQPGYFGSLDRRCLLDDVFWTHERVVSINDGNKPYKADFYCRALRHVFLGHEPTFTHADCQRKNIIIRPVAPKSDISTMDEFEVIIIDWEKAGWYPSYWEYCIAVSAMRWDDDWGFWIEKILKPYYPEAPWLQMLRLELWS